MERQCNFIRQTFLSPVSHISECRYQSQNRMECRYWIALLWKWGWGGTNESRPARLEKQEEVFPFSSEPQQHTTHTWRAREHKKKTFQGSRPVSTHGSKSIPKRWRGWTGFETVFVLHQRRMREKKGKKNKRRRKEQNLSKNENKNSWRRGGARVQVLRAPIPLPFVLFLFLFYFK